MSLNEGATPEEFLAYVIRHPEEVVPNALRTAEEARMIAQRIENAQNDNEYLPIIAEAFPSFWDKSTSAKEAVEALRKYADANQAFAIEVLKKANETP